MFDLEKEINNWKKSLRKNPSLEDGYIEELESHLRDKIEALINSDQVKKKPLKKQKMKLVKLKTSPLNFSKLILQIK